jgi:transcriptional regulator with XRE-family HTH domain
MFVSVAANTFARNERKMFCMTTTRGAIVKNWRNRVGISRAELARRVGTSRQNIENLEADRVENPKFLPRVAYVMGYGSTDDLLALKAPPEPGKEATSFIDGSPAPQTPQEIIAKTINRVGDLLAKASPNTRDAVMKLLLEYAQNPDQGPRLSQAMALLLEDEEARDPGVR